MNIDRLETETRELLRSAGISSSIHELSSEERIRTDAAAQRGLEQILRESRAQQRSLMRTPGRGYRKFAMALGAAAVVVAAAVGLVLHDTGGEGDNVAPAWTPLMREFHNKEGKSASSILEGLAEAASQQAMAASGDSIQRIVTVGWTLQGLQVSNSEDFDPKMATRQERYIFPDGSVREIVWSGQLIDAKGQMSDEDGSRTGSVTRDEVFWTSAETSEYIASLSTDPVLLAEQVAADCPLNPSCIGESIVDMNAKYVLDPVLVSTLWEALARTDGITYLGETVDRLGREAAAIQIPGPGREYVTVLYADPEAGRFLGSELVVTVAKPHEGLKAPAVVQFSALASASLIGESEVP
nr:hypothetical protein [Actinomycetales bacterium]